MFKLSDKAKQNLTLIKNQLGLNSELQAIEISLQLSSINIHKGSTIVKYLKGKQEGLSLTQIQRKYNINYNTLKNYQEIYQGIDFSFAEESPQIAKELLFCMSREDVFYTLQNNEIIENVLNINKQGDMTHTENVITQDQFQKLIQEYLKYNNHEIQF